VKKSRACAVCRGISAFAKLPRWNRRRLDLVPLVEGDRAPAARMAVIRQGRTSGIGICTCDKMLFFSVA